MLPSELKEDEWIKLVAQGGDYKSCIIFHVYYSELWAVATHPDAKASDTSSGLGITNDKDQADALYNLYKDNESITEERGGWRMVPSERRVYDYPDELFNQEEWSETVRTGVHTPND